MLVEKVPFVDKGEHYASHYHGCERDGFEVARGNQQNGADLLLLKEP
jgi:hypothetical protein